MTPEEAYSGHKPSVAHLKVFGCTAYVHVPDETRQKLDLKSKKCTFIGYATKEKAYRFYDPEKKTILISRDVVFVENNDADLKQEKQDSKEVVILDEDQDVSNSSFQPVGTENAAMLDGAFSSSISQSTSGSSTPRNIASGSQNIQAAAVPLQKKLPKWYLKTIENGAMHSQPETSKRMLRSSSKRCVNFALMATVLSSEEEPHSYEDASTQPCWISAMQEEYSSIVKNDTWELVPLPKGKKPIGTKWIYKMKFNSDGTLEKYKARLVAKGYVQREGIDYEETFAPVAKMNTIRTVLALATTCSWEICQMDVKSAFLNGYIDEEVYVTQPQGFVVKGHEDKVCKLKKALYGLKQAPRAWYSRIDEYLLKYGFLRSQCDPNLYILKSEADILILIVYVDDLIITGSSSAHIEKVKRSLSLEFDMKDLGTLHYCLGIEVWMQDKNMFLTQSRYVLELLKRFNMMDCKPVSTPLGVSCKLNSCAHEQAVDSTQFRQLVGSLIYLTMTRPDISYSVSIISQHMADPRESHWRAAKRILRYLKGTFNFGLEYTSASPISLYGYCDADWASDAEDRRSISGYVFSLGSGAISWLSKKQPTIALSSTEAEYNSAKNAVCETIWLRRLLNDLQLPQVMPTPIYCDNQSCIQISKNPVFHARTKHIEIHYHFVREKVLSKEIDLLYCSTDEQVADIFTKALGTSKFEYFRLCLGVKENRLIIKGEN